MQHETSRLPIRLDTGICEEAETAGKACHSGRSQENSAAPKRLQEDPSPQAGSRTYSTRPNTPPDGMPRELSGESASPVPAMASSPSRSLRSVTYPRMNTYHPKRPAREVLDRPTPIRPVLAPGSEAPAESRRSCGYSQPSGRVAGDDTGTKMTKRGSRISIREPRLGRQRGGDAAA